MISEVFNAVKAGQELKDPKKWKKGAMLSNLVALLLGGVFIVVKWKFPELPVPDGVEENFTEIIVCVLATINLYLFPATSKKIGL